MIAAPDSAEADPLRLDCLAQQVVGRELLVSAEVEVAHRPYLARAMARRSASLPIFERPRISRRAASSFSSLRVFASPLRTLFASLPSAVLVLPDRCFRVPLRLAPACAFFTLRRAAA